MPTSPPTVSGKPSKTDLTNEATATERPKVARSQQAISGSGDSSAKSKMTPAKFQVRPAKVCLVVGALILGLHSGQGALAWHFNFQPDLIAANQQAQSFPPQPFGGLNQNSNFYQPPSNPFASGNQFQNNQAGLDQALASSQQQQQQQQASLQSPPQLFLTPSTTSNVLSGGPSLSPPAGAFVGSPLFAPANRISSSEPTPVAETIRVSGPVAPANALADSASFSVTTGRPASGLSSSSEQPVASLAAPEQSEPARAATFPAEVHKKLAPDHEPTRSRVDSADKLSDAGPRDAHSETTSVRSDEPTGRQSAPPLADLAAVAGLTAAAATITTKPPTAAPASPRQASLPSGPPRQQLKPQRQASKDPHNSLELQIIDQHARASIANNQRHFESSSATTTTAPASVQQAPPAQQQLRLLPTKLRDNKLFNSFLSLALGDHNSQATDRESGPPTGAVDGRQQKQKSGGVLSSLVDNFKSGVTSRSSIVKAAMGDNKLARTLSTVGKTIGGNKYVAGAGIAAALAALGLTVSKLVSPYAMSGPSSPYSKLSSGFEQMTPAGSMLQPTFLAANTNRNYYFEGEGPFLANPLSPPTFNYNANNNNNNNNNGLLSDSLLAAANNQAYEQTLAAPPTSDPQFGGQTGDSFRFTKPSGPFIDSANGHYSSFYTSQPEVPTASVEQMESYARPTMPAPIYDNRQQFQAQFQPNQRYGSYVSGAPSQASPQFPYAPDSVSFYPSSAAPQYDTQASALNQESAANLDQIVAAASSEVQAAAYRPPQPPQPRRPSMAGNPRRSGAVSLKLDDGTRSQLRQQLQAAELVKSRTNLERLVAHRGQLGATHQSNDLDSSATQRVTPQQRFRPLASALPAQQSAAEGSSGPSSSFKTGRLVDMSRAATNQISADFRDKSKQAAGQQLVGERVQPATRVDLGAPARLAYPMQASRGEAPVSKPPAYLLIAPASSQTEWQVADLARPSRVSPNGSRPSQPKQSTSEPQVAGQTKTTAAPSGGWQSLEANAKQLDGDDDKGSSAAASESDSLVAPVLDEEKDNNNSPAASDNGQRAQDSNPARLRRTPPSNGRPEYFGSGWRPATGPTAASMSPPTRRPIDSTGRSNAEGKSDGSMKMRQDQKQQPERNMNDDEATASSQQRHKFQQQRHEELLQVVANGMGTNLIQLSPLGGGAEYQIETAANSDSDNPTAPANKATKPNKSIETKANPAANNAEPSSPMKPTDARPATTPTTPITTTSALNGRRSQPGGHRSAEAAASPAAAQQDDESVVVEPLPDDNDGAKQSSGIASATSVAASQPQSSDDSDDKTPGDKQRAFPGPVAGSVGAS